MLSRLAVAPCLAHDTCAELPACAIGDDAAAVLDRVYAADCLILGTPVYYENVSAQMKAFIDRHCFPYVHGRWLRAKAVGLVVVTAETGLQCAGRAAPVRRALVGRRGPRVHVRRLRGRGRRRGGRRRARRGGPASRRRARRRARPQPGLITRRSVTTAVTGRSCGSQQMPGTICASNASATQGVPGRVRDR